MDLEGNVMYDLYRLHLVVAYLLTRCSQESLLQRLCSKFLHLG